LIHYLTETEEQLEVLFSLAQIIIERNQTNFIECFRDFLLTTGGIALISERGSDDSATAEAKLTKVLEVFSSALLSSSHVSHLSNNNNSNSTQFQTMYDLSQCILTLNHAILTGQEAYALPVFFETIRKINSQKLQMFSPRELSSLYNTLRSNGPYIIPSRPQSNQELLSSPIFSTTCFVLYSQKNANASSHSLRSLASSTSTKNDSIFQKREIYLTSMALYLDQHDSGMECIPLESLQFVRSDKDNSTCELHPTDRANSLPVVEYRCLLNSNSISTDDEPSPQLFLTFYQSIQLRFGPLSDSETYLQKLDDCLWDLRTASFS
jgi:hypothetical protein